MKSKIPTDPYQTILPCFWTAVSYILLYELWFMNYPASSRFFYKLGVITSNIAYSTVAASVFFYLSVYLPKKRKKRIILSEVYFKTTTIDTIMRNLAFELNIHNDEIKQNEIFRAKIESINPNDPVHVFPNWYQYLAHIKTSLQDLIKSITFYNEYLSLEFFHELLILEQRLYSLYTFDGFRVLATSDLSYAELDIQELFVHNKHLQGLKDIEFKKYEREFKKDWKAYRDKYYTNSETQ